MKVTGVRQFRREVPRLVRGDEVVLVTWHGRLQSVLLPLKDIRKLPRDLRMEFLRQSGKDIRAILRKRGITEEELLADFQAWRKARRGRTRVH
jgi:hypothetical protein